MARQIKLKRETQFGRIPFDLYALDNWDYEAPKETDGEQWKQLAKRYLALAPIDRRPYHERAEKLKKAKNDGSNPNLIFDKIERVLKPFQTNKERNASELSSSRDPIWVQLCYDKELEYKYADLADWADVGDSEGSVDLDMVMDDDERYDLDDDPDRLRQKLLERMPGLCDHRRSHYRQGEGRLWRLGPGSSLKSQDQHMVTFFYFVDREAIQGEFVKVMWLDAYGTCLRITKMAPSALAGMRSMFNDGYTMEEAVLDRGIGEADEDGGDDHDDEDSDGDDDDDDDHDHDDDNDSDDKERSPKKKGKRKADPGSSEKGTKKTKRRQQ